MKSVLFAPLTEFFKFQLALNGFFVFASVIIKPLAIGATEAD